MLSVHNIVLAFSTFICGKIIRTFTCPFSCFHFDWLRIVGSPPSQRAVMINHMDCFMCHDLCCFEDLQYISNIKH